MPILEGDIFDIFCYCGSYYGMSLAMLSTLLFLCSMESLLMKPAELAKASATKLLVRFLVGLFAVAARAACRVAFGREVAT